MKALRIILQPWTDPAVQIELLCWVEQSLKPFALQVSKRTFVTKNRNGTLSIIRPPNINRHRIWRENSIIISTSERTTTSVLGWWKRTRARNQRSVHSCLTQLLFLNVQWKTSHCFFFVTKAVNMHVSCPFSWEKVEQMLTHGGHSSTIRCHDIQQSAQKENHAPARISKHTLFFLNSIKLL